MTTFAELGLPEPLVRKLEAQGLVQAFPVQAGTIPDALSGKDISGRAPTGSGKTLAFGLPVLARVGKSRDNRPRSLILAPTRELAEQIGRDLAPLARSMDRWIHAIYGGVGYKPQLSALRRGVDVLVATPGRLEDLIAQGAVDLSDVDLVVVDEADRMADMGFLPTVRRILDQTADRRQTLLFSATLDGEIAELSRRYQHDPVSHESEPAESSSKEASHHFWLVDRHDRAEHTADLVRRNGRSIIFTRTRHGADRLAKQLSGLGVEATAMHGGRSQGQRNRALAAFTSGRSEALVATDVAARGIHVDSVETVIHFDVAADSKDYVHRSGRTARAGAGGAVVTLLTADQRTSVNRMQRDLGLPVSIDKPQTGFGEARKAPHGSPQTSGTRGQSLYVANLPWKTTAEDMTELFGRYGKVREATIITDRRSGRSRGFGFVEMDEPDARKAIVGLQGSQMGGRPLTVRAARPR